MKKNVPVQWLSSESREGESPSLGIFQSILDTILCHVLHAGPSWAGRWDQMSPSGRFQLCQFWNSESFPSWSIPCVIQNCWQQKKKKKILFKQFQTDTSLGYKPLSRVLLHTSQTHQAWWCAVSSEDSSNSIHSLSTGNREGYEALKQQLNCTSEGKQSGRGRGRCSEETPPCAHPAQLSPRAASRAGNGTHRAPGPESRQEQLPQVSPKHPFEQQVKPCRVQQAGGVRSPLQVRYLLTRNDAAPGTWGTCTGTSTRPKVLLAHLAGLPLSVEMSHNVALWEKGLGIWNHKRISLKRH